MPFDTANVRSYHVRRCHLHEGGTPWKRRLPDAILGWRRRLGLPPRHFCRRRGRSRPRPTILDDFGLEAGLRWLVEGFAARTGIQATLASRCSGRLPDDTETHLFRPAQEALTNVSAPRRGQARRSQTEIRRR
jgi:hypothetical protein